MTTVRQIIADAMEDLQIRSSITPLTDSEYNRGIRSINRLMTTWAEDGINPGFTKIESIANLDNDIQLPDWFEDCLISHLALRLAPSFGIVPDATRYEIAQKMLDAIQHRLVQLGPVNFPNTLPVGSGNNDRSYGLGDYFSKENPESIYTSSGDQIDDDTGIDLTI